MSSTSLYTYTCLCVCVCVCVWVCVCECMRVCACVYVRGSQERLTTEEGRIQGGVRSQAGFSYGSFSENELI